MLVQRRGKLNPFLNRAISVLLVQSVMLWFRNYAIHVLFSGDDGCVGDAVQ